MNVKRLAVATVAALATASGTGTAYAADQTATDSVGTVQVVEPAVSVDATASAPTSADAGSTVTTEPTVTVTADSEPGQGGDQSADNSTGTIQIGGGGNQTADNSTGTIQVGGGGPTGGGPSAGGGGESGVLQPEAAPARGVAGLQTAAPPAAPEESQTGGPLGVSTTPTPSLTRTGTLGQLPFTGLAVWLVALIGLAIAAAGLGLRRGQALMAA